ncbi:MAG: hypothetical protein KAI24_03225 [Planctomycetes bacterium]|nr:hypothetical protein [Planctomycetota bacterium]
MVLNPSGSADKIQHGYVRNRRGFVTQETRNESSTQPLVITRDYNSGDLPSEVSMTVGGVPHEERFYYDMYGNLAVHLTANLDHTGAPPDDFGSTPRQDSARSWIRNEWHYLGGHLLTEFRDRRPLDRDADGAEYDDPLALYQRSDYIWRGDGALLEVALPNGASRGFVVDGYGTIYKDETRASSGTDVVLNAKYLVDASLDVVRVIDGLGAVTTIERNVAGVIESVTQPATTVAPPNYAYSLPAQLKTEFDTNAVGQLTEVRQLEAGSTTPLVRRTFDYDAIGRRCRAEVFSGASATALQEFTWVYEGATKLKESHTPGGRYVKRTFDALARVSEALDSLDAANGDANPNKVIYINVDNAPFVAGITRRNIDGAATSSAAVDRVTTYERDELGRVTKAKVGSTTATLDHSFGYYTTGATAVYTDPEGKLERFLPDALGRIRERFLPGTQPIWNGTIWRDWTGTADQLERDQVDGLGHVTTTIMDFAGRTRVLMEPGSTTQPTPANKHQANAKFYEYDAASRLSNVYLGDDVHIAFDRDAAGRLLQRRRLFSQANVLVSDLWGGDRLRRNALGQIVELSSYTGIGPGGVGKDYINEEFLHDVVGRTLWEDFEYGANVSNRVRVTSEFVGGDPFRTGLSVVNSIGSPSTPSGPSVDLHMQFVPDAIGRVASISWKADGAAAAPWVALADYTHEGGLTRPRKTTQGLGVAQGATPFDFTTTYSYDDYGRMEKIEHSYGATPSYEFVFDDSSNLVKEKYAKQSGAVGDRFSYDEHNRLLDAWLDSDAQHFAETDPNSGIGTFVKKLTYGLDQANNRDTVTENGVVESYALEAGSNRYSQVGADPMAYDSRGNTHLTPDGCYLVYDANNRLTEVYKMVPQEVSSGASAPQEGSTTTFAVTDYSALDTARTQILQRLAPRVDYLLHIPDDAQVRADSKQGLSPSVAQSTTTDSSGASSQDSVVLEMVAFYLYDPMNRRVVRWVRDDATYYYAYDGWEEVQRYGLGSATTYSQSARGEQFDELIAYRTKVDTGAWVNRYVAEGGAHCPMRILDEAGNEVEVQEYDPYGRATYWASGQASGASSVGMSYGWRMMVLDPETGLYYVRNRFYSAELGRFCSKDPLGVDGDPATWLNAYNFGSATPLTQNDPLGLQVFLSQLVDELGLNPGERAEFDQTQTSPSGKPFDGVGRDVDGTPYAFTDSVGRLLFPIGDFQATSHWFWKGTWHLLNGATAGIPGMLTSDPHGDLCAETASDYILEEVGGLVPWAAMFSWLKWGDRASDAVKALDRAGDAVRNADNAADASRGAQGTLNFGRRICFEAGTQVNTPDGSITIESVEAGDEVYAYDETSGEVVISRVVRTFAKRAEALVDLTVQYSGSGRSYVLSGTPEHPFYVPELGEYVAMGELEAGAILRTTDGITARVVSSRLRRGEFDVFNFEVEGEHNYFVSPPMSEEVGILVHNDCFDLVRKANNLPRNARLSTNEADIFARLAKHNGIDPKLAGSRLHDIKAAAGRGGADNVIFDFTGNVFSPQTGELLGSLTQGGARVIR